MSPCPSVRMSMNAWRSKLSAIARRRSGLSKGGFVPIDDQGAVEADRPTRAARLRHLALHVFQVAAP